MRVRVHAVLLFVQASFAAFHVFGKHILAEMDPMVLAALRVAFAAPVLLVAAHFVDGYRPKRRDFLHFAYLGLFGVCLNQLLFIHGLERTSATNAAILQAVEDLDSFWRLTPDGMVNTVAQMDALGIVGNGNNSTIGDFDLDRVADIITIIGDNVPSIEVPAGLSAEDLVTNEFIDTSIGR